MCFLPRVYLLRIGTLLRCSPPGVPTGLAKDQEFALALLDLDLLALALALDRAYGV